MKYKKYYEARDIIQDIIAKDFIGPVEENEIISEEPLKYYSMGILYPQNSDVEDDNLGQVDTDEPNEKEESYYEKVYLSNSYYPSSFSMTTTVKEGVSNICVNLSYAKYELVIDKLDENINSKKNKKWKRKLYNKKFIVDIPNQSSITSPIKVDDTEKVILQIYTNRIIDNKFKTITVTLMNTSENTNDFELNNLNSIFQTNMSISSVNYGEPIFIENDIKLELNQDSEVKSLDMLYSHVKNYAFGHGCSVDWKENEYGAYEIMMVFIPNYELKQMKPAINVEKSIFNMDFMSNGNRNLICSELIKFTDSYMEWIDQESCKISNLKDRYLDVANKNITLCRETHSRLKNSIKLLATNDMAFKAFQLANKAMLNQRIQFEKRKNEKVDISKIKLSINWYPFQLAFILQELYDIVNENSDYRDKVDLLWFPTGGGKTEAYLGLAAFTIFYRRLRDGNNGAGVSVIMRYTLRLLTVQQFERAHALICACELIRKNENISKDPISIGLYVGGGLTPNNRLDAIKNLKALKDNKDVKEANPCQILKCPWCGEEIDKNDYFIDEEQMVIKCHNVDCEFNSGLPVYLIDDDIYDYKPTLIISTVDKFARMTWESKIGEIFSQGKIIRPPELIIQDELHLISGPLGTITGLYEVAFKKLCEYNDIPCKIVASTATIRNAGKQIAGLYGRKFKQFPPSGINIRDSYFAEESNREERPARMYTGILAPGKSMLTTQVRLYSALLFAVRRLKDLGYDDDIINNFWTLTGYFNTLKELGSAMTQIHDNVQDRYKFLCKSKFAYLNPQYPLICTPDEVEELTSRKSSAEITEALKNVEVNYPSKSAFDFLLASNMISVGVDIGRLGLMTIINQPKTNSEYIQASSRVGRTNPGIVFTVYNPIRSRDKSHYEQFKLYHSSIYKYVEATSVTPFSSRARDKALHAVYISLCRHLIPELSDNKNAFRYNSLSEKSMQIRESIKHYISNEVETIVNLGVGLQSDINETLIELDYIESDWEWKISEGENISYSDSNSQNSLLTTNIDNKDKCFFTLNSMRNVDVQSNIYLEE